VGGGQTRLAFGPIPLNEMLLLTGSRAMNGYAEQARLADCTRKHENLAQGWPGSISADDLGLIAPEIPPLNECPEDDPRKEEGEEIFDPGETYSQAPSTEPPPEPVLVPVAFESEDFLITTEGIPDEGTELIW
jgi:hypothetical protein